MVGMTKKKSYYKAVTPVSCDNCGASMSPSRPSISGQHYCGMPACQSVRRKNRKEQRTQEMLQNAREEVARSKDGQSSVPEEQIKQMNDLYRDAQVLLTKYTATSFSQPCGACGAQATIEGCEHIDPRDGESRCQGLSLEFRRPIGDLLAGLLLERHAKAIR